MPAWLPAVPAVIGVGICLALVHPTAFGPPRRLLPAGGLPAPSACRRGTRASAPRSNTVPCTMLGGIQAWVYSMFYLSWLLWAPAIGVATWNHQQRTRGVCRACGRARPRRPTPWWRAVAWTSS
ncbi:hypothetical protein [Pseudonocardia nigra]|uniref:hypothetical protein n=1 Tax=Pseudonocardia nigra TaxID=1921578 RepID=UPI001C5CE4C5|nr:hypothetical protein [Pseudonocardia nigra]